jgi:hypothetical protein
MPVLLEKLDISTRGHMTLVNKGSANLRFSTKLDLPRYFVKKFDLSLRNYFATTERLAQEIKPDKLFLGKLSCFPQSTGLTVFDGFTTNL